MPPKPTPTDVSLQDVRERLARLEVTTASYSEASIERHDQVLAELRRLAARVEHIESRLWRQATLLVVLGVLAVGGSASVAPLLKTVLGQ